MVSKNINFKAVRNSHETVSTFELKMFGSGDPKQNTNALESKTHLYSSRKEHIGM